MQKNTILAILIIHFLMTYFFINQMTQTNSKYFQNQKWNVCLKRKRYEYNFQNFLLLIDFDNTSEV